jgi:hypothetical protein
MYIFIDIYVYLLVTTQRKKEKVSQDEDKPLKWEREKNNSD